LLARLGRLRQLLPQSGQLTLPGRLVNGSANGFGRCRLNNRAEARRPPPGQGRSTGDAYQYCNDQNPGDELTVEYLVILVDVVCYVGISLVGQRKLRGKEKGRLS